MKTISLITQGKFAIVDDDDFERLSKQRWHFSHGYARGKVGKIKTSMHREIMHPPAGMEVDHIDHNGLNNQKSNLRICTPSDNQHNAKLRKDNTSGYKGVKKATKTKSWEAQIRIKDKRIYLGTYSTPKEVAIAYDNAAKEYFGEFSATNF